MLRVTSWSSTSRTLHLTAGPPRLFRQNAFLQQRKGRVVRLELLGQSQNCGQWQHPNSLEPPTIRSDGLTYSTRPHVSQTAKSAGCACSGSAAGGYHGAIPKACSCRALSGRSIRHVYCCRSSALACGLRKIGELGAAVCARLDRIFTAGSPAGMQKVPNVQHVQQRGRRRLQLYRLSDVVC